MVAYEPLLGDLDVDVLVIGGGIAGTTTALLRKEAGRSVALVEADRLASGSTGRSTGTVTSQHDLFYVTVVDKVGEASAQRSAEANQAAIAILEGLTDRHGVDAYPSRLASHVFTRDESMVDAVRIEADAARRLGLPTAFVEDVDLSFAVAGAVRFDGQLQIHPSRVVRGFAAAVAGDGWSVHEHSRVVGMSANGDTVEVTTERGTIRARQPVVATVLPVLDQGFEFAKTRPSRSYGIAAGLGGEPSEPMHISAESPKRSRTRTRIHAAAARRPVPAVTQLAPPTGSGPSYRRGTPTPRMCSR